MMFFNALAACALLAMLSAVLGKFAVRHKRLMLCVGVCIAIFGCCIYWDRSAHWIVAVCNSIYSFFPSRGDFGQKSVDPVSLWYSVFHGVVMVYVLSLILAVFGIELVNKCMILWRGMRNQPINVFWDYSNEAWNLAKSIECSGTECSGGTGSVVFALREENKAWFTSKMSGTVQTIEKEGWKWMFGAPGSTRTLLCANRHFFVSPNGHENVAGAEALIAMLAKRKITGRHIRVYVRVHSLATDDVVFRWADAWNKQEENHVEIIVLREEAIVSRNFLLRHPMLDCPIPDCPSIMINTETGTVKGEFKVLLLGFGCQGRTLLNDMICDAQFLDANGSPIKISVDVVDRSVSAYGEYLSNNEEATMRYNMQFHNMDVHDGCFWKWVHERLKEDGWNRIVICMRDDRENISVATEIGRHCKWLGRETKGLLFARVRDPHITAYVEKAMAESKGGVFSAFGCIADTYRYDAIVNDKWDIGAMMLNFRWSQSKDDSVCNTPEHKWKTASCFNRESSRASFFFQRNMLRLLGYRMDGSTATTIQFKPADVATHLDVLARTEHLRWMAWHFVRGIKPFGGDMAGKYSTANQIETRNAHGDLVDFDKLPNPEKKKDINLVASDAWQRSGLGIRRA